MPAESSRGRPAVSQAAALGGFLAAREAVRNQGAPVYTAAVSCALTRRAAGR